MTDDLSDIQTHDIPAGFEPLPWHRGFGRQVGPLYHKQNPDGSYVRGFRVEEHHTNGMMNAHGGMLMTFADLAWGHVVDPGPNYWWVTIRLMCDFLSSARHGEWVEANGEIVSEVDHIYTVRGRIWSGDRTLMSGTGLFKAIERKE